MSAELKVWVKIDGNTAELFVRFITSAFSGQSSAWFSLEDLKLFAKAFDQYPINPHTPPIIEGGYWDSTGKTIRQEHLHISAYPKGSLGDLDLLVRLAVPTEDPSEMKLKNSASAVFSTNYEQMAEFSRSLIALTAGQTVEVSFNFEC